MKRIYIDTEKDLIDAPLWYHKQGLYQTASGYGRKLNTGKKYKYNGRLYRVYVCQYSNIGTAYIIVNKEWIVLS
jgi:hypothetical protein